MSQPMFVVSTTPILTPEYVDAEAARLEEESQRGLHLTWLGALGLAALGVAGYFYWKRM